MPHLRCWTDSLPEGALVHVDGDVDLATAPILADCLAKAFDAHACAIVDLDGVPYLDSSGLHVLARTAARHAGRFVVVQSTPRVRRLLDILGIDGLLPVTASIAEAQKYLRDHDCPPGGRGLDSATSAADGME